MENNSNLPPQQPPQQVPQYYNQNTGYKKSDAATWALVLGILSWVTCGVFTAIPAWIIGQNVLNDVKRGVLSQDNKSTAQIGMWLGIANIILTVLSLIFALIIILFSFGIIATILEASTY